MSDFDTRMEAITHLAKICNGGLVEVVLDRSAFVRLLMEAMRVPKAEIADYFDTLENFKPFHVVTAFGMVRVRLAHPCDKCREDAEVPAATGH